jgi:hypothetical protein
MVNLFRPHLLLSVAVIGMISMLGGCVAYPAYPVYGAGYGYSAPYYGGPYVGVGGGWRERGWHDHDGGWRH